MRQRGHSPALETVEWPLESRGLPLGLRVLAGVGAAAFLMVGVNSALVGVHSLSVPQGPAAPTAR